MTRQHTLVTTAALSKDGRATAAAPTHDTHVAQRLTQPVSAAELWPIGSGCGYALALADAARLCRRRGQAACTALLSGLGRCSTMPLYAGIGSNGAPSQQPKKHQRCGDHCPTMLRRPQLSAVWANLCGDSANAAVSIEEA